MNLGVYIVAGCVVLGLAGLGAWLVIAGHPWFGLLAMLLAGCVSVRASDS